MRLTPWILPLALSAALITTTNYVLADNHESGDKQHEPLDDAALEEEYGIKAGAVKRDPVEDSDSEQPSDETDRTEEDEDETLDEPADDETRGSADESDAADAENNGERTADGDEAAEGGTGGTGSSENALANGEDDKSTDDDGESEESTDDNE